MFENYHVTKWEKGTGQCHKMTHGGEAEGV